ncbi:MAG: ABC transporter ATP-binding protein [Xanthobacteraceae bacterium]
MAIVKLDKLTKLYSSGHPPAADNVSLTIQDGEFMVLLGPSGCGKTTTLRMIAGLESISGGELSIDGQKVNDKPAKDRDIAMVFQSYALYPHMSVKDNLAFGLRRRKVPREEIERRVGEACRVLGLVPYLARKPHALSGGQRQRVALGRAIVREPKVFLFDEPLSNLDAALRVSTRTEIAALHRRLGATMIYVTHDQVEAMTLGTRICIMSGGRVMQVGPPLEVYQRPVNTFVAGFLGNPPMNLIPARVESGGAAPVVQIGDTVLAIPTGRVGTLAAGSVVTFGIRPESLSLDPRPGAAPGARLSGTAEQIEALGAETILTVRIDGQADRIADRVIARIAGDAGGIALGQPCTLSLDLNEAHLFDGAGMAVRP